MTAFSEIPEVVIDYVREVFAQANDKITRTVALHPSMHEPTLDNMLVMELTAAPPAFFAAERVGVAIETHWLGGRWMYDRWEIADIAFVVMLRKSGHLVVRKVALLQTKRLYSDEIEVTELDVADYEIGIARLVDRTDPTVPISNQRAFGFDLKSAYKATASEHPQIERIDRYTARTGLPVYYGFYNPPALPFRTLYPVLEGVPPAGPNQIGCRVLPAPTIHSALNRLAPGTSPRVSDLASARPLDPADEISIYGWRLERFVADEVLRCRQGRLFDDRNDPNLRSLLFGRSAPISAAITITIDIASTRADL